MTIIIDSLYKVQSDVFYNGPNIKYFKENVQVKQV